MARKTSEEEDDGYSPVGDVEGPDLSDSGGTRRVTSAMARGTKGVQRTSSGRFKCKKKIKLNIISNFCEKLITYFGFVYEI